MLLLLLLLFLLLLLLLLLLLFLRIFLCLVHSSSLTSVHLDIVNITVSVDETSGPKVCDNKCREKQNRLLKARHIFLSKILRLANNQTQNMGRAGLVMLYLHRIFKRHTDYGSCNLQKVCILRDIA